MARFISELTAISEIEDSTLLLTRDATASIDYKATVGELSKHMGVVTPQQFGAVADAYYDANGKLIGTDNSAAFQQWADVGGNLFLPRGVYKVSSQVNFNKPCYVLGEGAGVGAGGGTWTLQEQAINGASIIVPDAYTEVIGGTPTEIDNFVGDAVFNAENVDDIAPINEYTALPSIGFANFKIECIQTKGVQAHLLRVVDAYDALEIRNLNIMFNHKYYHGLFLDTFIGPNKIFPGVAQTAIVTNSTFIGDNDAEQLGGQENAAIIKLVEQQEMQFIGVKAIGSYQAGVDTADRNAWAVEDCRGITFIGCSAAVTGPKNFGFDIYNVTKNVDGIALIGTTFEDCGAPKGAIELGDPEGGGAWRLDGDSRNIETDPNQFAFLTNCNITDSRYQFPASLGGKIYAAQQCEVDTAGARTYLYAPVNKGDGTVGSGHGGRTAGNVIHALNQSTVTDNSGEISTVNTVVSTNGDAQIGMHYSQPLTVQRNNPSLHLMTPNSSEGWHLQGSIADGADVDGFPAGANFGLIVQKTLLEVDDIDPNIQNRSKQGMFNFAPDGDFQFLNEYAGLDLCVAGELAPTDPSYEPNKYKLNLDPDGNLVIQNVLDPSDVHINNDRPFVHTSGIYTLSSLNVGGTIRTESAVANIVRIPTISIPIGAVVKVVQKGAGVVTIDGAAGVTINSTLNGSVVLNGGGYASNNPAYATITKVGVDEWEVLLSVQQFQITYDDAASQTFTKQATNTYINRSSTLNPTYTLDSSTFSEGDRVLISRIKNAAGVLTVETVNETFYPPEGGATYPQTLTTLGTMVLIKRGVGDGWHVTGDYT